MKRISISINYYTQLGECLVLAIEGNDYYPMVCQSNSQWETVVEFPVQTTLVEFSFLLKRDNTILRREYGNPHMIQIPPTNCSIRCEWQDMPTQKYFGTSIFYNSIFKQAYRKLDESPFITRFTVNCRNVEQSQELVICGESETFGSWDVSKGKALKPISYGKWVVDLLEEDITELGNYKFAIRDRITKQLIDWEDGANRYCYIENKHAPEIIELSYRKENIDWKASGVAVPIFSLRSEDSLGVGEFSDLKLLIDWAANAQMKVIQTLPINDTTNTYSWTDSYPYNAISIYALHPIYLGMRDFELKDKRKYNEYIKKGKELNELPILNYEEALQLKISFQQDLYNEIGGEVLSSAEFKEFFNNNEDWLFPYAWFCYLRDKYQTAKFSAWKEFSVYDKSLLQSRIDTDNKIKGEINRSYFIQFLLHKQLKEVKEYAYTKGLTLKGDIPIGISPNSVEAWIEPHLFNMDCQTGAPPDDFSVDGQNWGFPTYNWAEMAKDGYLWWRKRFKKMADYFDSYRIDHILGFFRIWEIPQTSVDGLLGYFSPALPLSVREIEDWGYSFDELIDTRASIHKDDLKHIFRDASEEVVNKYLSWNGDDSFTLNKEVATQQKIQEVFRKLPNSERNKRIREGLYRLTSEVLFIKDKYDAATFHPRISLHKTLKYKRLEESCRNTLSLLHDDYFYRRHTEFWKEEAMSKLPALIGSTDMLVCGEDLGMVPDCVPEVMSQLEILALEIQRMPKQMGVRFSLLEQFPYLSVVTTSTHDMSPLRLWWRESREGTQAYYETQLHLKGVAPTECNALIIAMIVDAHLKSPAMLAILPLQDWLSMNDRLKREKPEEERINIPSNPKHNWNYRMHLTLEELLEAKEFSETIKIMNQQSGR